MTKALAALLVLLPPLQALAATPDEMCAAIRKDVADYLASGSPCACPYNLMRNGRQCGDRSAWSKPAGRAPRCFFGDFDGTFAALQKGDAPRHTAPPRPACPGLPGTGGP